LIRPPGDLGERLAQLAALVGRQAAIDEGRFEQSGQLFA
jgi:hypothetical protein